MTEHARLPHRPVPKKGRGPTLKLLISALAVAATLGGWTAFSASDPSAAGLASTPAVTAGPQAPSALRHSQPPAEQLPPGSSSGAVSITTGSAAAPPAPLARTRSSR